MPNTAPPRNMPKKKIVLAPIQRVLAKVRPMWIERVGKELARGMEVRADFEEQLGRFFDLLEQSVTTGDPAWMDTVLMDWAKSSTETFQRSCSPISGTWRSSPPWSAAEWSKWTPTVRLSIT